MVRTFYFIQLLTLPDPFFFLHYFLTSVNGNNKGRLIPNLERDSPDRLLNSCL